MWWSPASGIAGGLAGLKVDPDTMVVIAKKAVGKIRNFIIINITT